MATQDIPQLQRVPWSQLGPEFIESWGHDENGDIRGEHIEIAGQTGSGKSYLLATILQQRAEKWDTNEIVVLTKAADDSIPKLGWPRVTKIEDLKKYKQSMYWPETSATGEAREQFFADRIRELLGALWVPDSNCVIAFDEIGFVESLGRDIQKEIRMYWREGRSHGISIIAMKQRPIGVQRDQHSESRWKFVFPPADYGDMDRFSEMLGKRAVWSPVLESLDNTKHEFIVRNSVTKDAFISWVDTPLKPLPQQQKQKEAGARETFFGRKPEDSERKS